jgi:hypothetical protein
MLAFPWPWSSASSAGPVVGFVINTVRIAELEAGYDRTHETKAEELMAAG